MNKIIGKIENCEFSTREYFFVGIILFLAGLLFGIIVSPKGARVIGSNNGNNNSDCVNAEEKKVCNEEE